MKKIIGSIVIGMFLMPVCLSAADKAVESPLKTSKEKLSYSMGLDLGKYLQNAGDELDIESIKLGMEDGYTGAEPKMSPEEIAAVQKEFTDKMKAKQEAELAAMKEKNSAAGKAYLEENKKKEGVKITESGLQYEVLKAAEGKRPAATDMVKVDYVGTLVNGDEFDSSVKRGEPATFGVNQVIPGWSEALQLMEVGSKYRVVIPTELAYGEAGAPPVIEPNSVLIFEIDLLAIEEAEPTEPAEKAKQ